MNVAVRPIRDEIDYDLALALADALLSAEPGTPDGERLDALVASIEAYEAHRWPVTPPVRPGA